MPDFNLYRDQSLAVITPLTPEAREWTDEHVNVETEWGAGFVVEHRYLNDIVIGLVKDGLTIGEDQ